jgi:hypothetical protein
MVQMRIHQISIKQFRVKEMSLNKMCNAKITLYIVIEIVLLIELQVSNSRQVIAHLT